MEERIDELQNALRDMESERDDAQNALSERNHKIDDMMKSLNSIATRVGVPWFDDTEDVDALCARVCDALDDAGALARAIDEMSYHVDELKKLVI